MKLVEILARDLGAWPRDLVLVQGAGGSVYEAGGGEFIGFYDLSEDWTLAEVTRPQWQAERDRMKTMGTFDKQALHDELRSRQGKRMPIPDCVEPVEPTYEQQLWDRVAFSALGGIASRMPYSNPDEAGFLAAQYADAFMAERAKRIKGE